MGRTLIAGILAAAALAAATAGGSDSTGSETVDCGTRIQVDGRAGPGGSDDLRLGHLYLAGLRQQGADAHPEAFEPQPGKRRAFVKSASIVDAGAPVTLAVPRHERERMKLVVARFYRPHAQGHVIKLEPCPPDAEVAGNPVGPRTPFVGGIQVNGPGCYTLRARPEGGEPVTRRVRLGVESCG